MPSSLFSQQNIHIHPTQPNYYSSNTSHLAPPSSFSRTGTSGFRTSLRKKTSSIFNKSENKIEQRTMKGERLQVFQEEEEVTQPEPVRQDGTKLKTKIKPRKALADILGWGNTSTNSNITQPTRPLPSKVVSPTTLAPPVPPKETGVLRKRPSRPMSTKSAQSNYSSLYPASSNAPRASIGEDPFHRRGEGAEVVEHVVRHGVRAPSVTSSKCDTGNEKRFSGASSKALSSRTYIGEESSIKEVDHKGFLSSPPIIEEPNQKRHVSNPPPSHITMTNLPPRSASLGRTLDTAKILPSSPISPPKLVINAPTSPEKVSVGKGLKREKTKSKVWGMFLGGKSKKEKVKEEEILIRPVDDVKSRVSVQPYNADTFRTDSTFSTMRSTTSTIQPTVAQIPVKRSARIPPPALIPNIRPLPPTSFKLDTIPSIESPPLSATFNHASTHRYGTTTSTFRANDTVPAVQALLAPRGVPKRKSLTGLFGLAIKKSMDRMRGTVAPAGSPGKELGKPIEVSTLRSLAEEMGEVEHIKPFCPPSPPYRSRFGDHALAEVPQTARTDSTLNGVASATDKLLDLVSHFDPSPGSTPGTKTIAQGISPALSDMPSVSSMSASVHGSPTPMRRTRSALLTNRLKVRASPLKTAALISPLKAALERATALANSPDKAAPASLRPSPIKTSLVQKGMRNVFAPPSPPTSPPTTITRSNTFAQQVMDESVGMGQTMGPEIVSQRMMFADEEYAIDLPIDLLAIVMDSDNNDEDDDDDYNDNDNDNEYTPPSPTRRASGTNYLGLPLQPAQNRISPRRPALAPPMISLPPLPDIPAHLAPGGHGAFADEEDEAEEGEAISNNDLLGVGRNDYRNSFDFTGEYARLDLGNQRASFVEALHKVKSGILVADMPSSPTALEYSGEEEMGEEGMEDEDDRFGDLDDESEYDEEEAELEHHSSTSTIQKARIARPAPFQGQFAFQQRVTQAKEAAQQTLTFVIPPTPVAALPDTEITEVPANTRRRAHHRNESGFSIASMSSIGTVIETGIAGEYTNYFEVNFSNHLAAQGISRTRNSVSSESLASTGSRRSHHRRNSSIVSLESVGGEIERLHPVGPPVSMHNSRRSSYISKHRRVGSTDSATGRSDWAAHRRNTSVESNASGISFARIGRPGLGDRMFQLDGGVQLTSITASPPDDTKPTVDSPPKVQPPQPAQHARQWSYDSLFDEPHDSFDSLFNPSVQEGCESMFNSSNRNRNDSLFSVGEVSRDSLFGSVDHNRSVSIDQESVSDLRQPFLIKGLRPISTISTATTASVERTDDTCIDVAKYAKHLVQKDENCLQGEGEDESTMTPVEASRYHQTGRQLLNNSISRPAKPRGGGRRRPANLIFNTSMDTPGLTSPSASETSSRISLETRFSEVPSVFSASRIRPRGMGHARQISSSGLRLPATIKEQPSIATLRANRASSSPPRVQVVGWDGEVTVGTESAEKAVKSWLSFQREADDEFKRTKNSWEDSEESKHAVAEFRMPTTTSEIAAFLAKSSQAYKPLEKLPLGRIAHRRKSSLSDSRQLTSPYGHPLARPPHDYSSRSGSYQSSSGPSSYGHTDSSARTGSAKNAMGLPLPQAHNVIPGKKKGSLQTKFERTNSATSSHFSNISDEDPISPPPVSAVFAQFTRELPPSPPPKLAVMIPFSPFQVPAFVSTGNVVKEQTKESEQAEKARTEMEAKRARVNSSVRRQALGWGRRRNSDGPAKVVEAEEKQKEIVAPKRTDVEGLVTSTKPLTIRGQENVNPSKSRTRTKSTVGRRSAKKAASQPFGGGSGLRI